jgi:hypothetical protein
MVDETNIPTLEELEAQFPYDSETPIPNPSLAPPSPIDFSNIAVFELYDWNAFTMQLPHISFKTLHFVGKANINGTIITSFTGPLKPYDKENDWYRPLGEFDGAKPYKLTGTRDMFEQFPQSIIDAMQATEIMPIVRPESYRYPNFNPSEQNA